MRICDIVKENIELQKRLKINKAYIKSRDKSYNKNMEKMGIKIRTLREEVKNLNAIIQKDESLRINVITYKNIIDEQKSLINTLLIEYNKLKTPLHLNIPYNNINNIDIYGNQMIYDNYYLNNVIEYLKNVIYNMNKHIYQLTEYNTILYATIKLHNTINKFNKRG